MHAYFHTNTAMAKEKPSTLIDTHIPCPFCDKATLLKENNLLIDEGRFLLIKNKFPVFQDTFQTVLIEHPTCDFDLSTYPKEHLYPLIEFALTNWFSFSENKQFLSSILIKNHGLHAGGSIAHAHMQIIGLEKIDYKQNISATDFFGLPIREGDVSINLSTFPKSEMYEFNIKMKKENWKENIPLFSTSIQQVIHYILNHLNKKTRCYNLAFYEFEGDIIVKIISRRPSTIFYLGYNIHQVPSSLADVCSEFTDLYLT